MDKSFVDELIELMEKHEVETIKPKDMDAEINAVEFEFGMMKNFYIKYKTIIKEEL